MKKEAPKNLLSQLKVNKGATHYPKRLGRGDSSGYGGTSTKGHKGQIARTGGKVRRGFEGGQKPIHMRIPKQGFSNVPFNTDYAIVNLEQLEKLSGDITPETLKKNKIIKGVLPVKILGHGKLTKSLNVKAHKFSESAKKAIEKAGGKAEVINS